ncbi:Protein of unknown function [Algoriphagus locisalis]|uniref:DUF3137 domain-containing protein n=1 Tax=Algoriphagus locisalis TaxID=305507 RepID=A0A1I7E8M8_9BACT|nr:DUF3137 domain-containing protein [Algoriphagus locisalis]SFU20284.1 Protein of unknown function [Algoriphagus locisalis]
MDQHLLLETFTEVQASLEDIQLKRKRTHFYQKITWGITGIYLLGMLLMMSSLYLPGTEFPLGDILSKAQPSASNPYAQILPLAGLMVLIYFSTSFFIRAFQKFKTQEMKTMASMVQKLFPNLEFTQGASPPKKEILSSKLFAWLKNEDPVYNFGQLRSRSREVEFNLADIGIIENDLSNKATDTVMQIPLLNLAVVMYRYVFKNLVSNKPQENLPYSFRGMFCWLKFQKKLDGHTVVLSRNQGIKLDRWSSFKFREEQEIYLEDPRFTENFIVYGTDQVEARYVLSTSLMERILELKEKYDNSIYLSFQNKQLYLAVKNENGLFSFPSGNIKNIQVLEELTRQIEIGLEVKNSLRLH